MNPRMEGSSMGQETEIAFIFTFINISSWAFGLGEIKAISPKIQWVVLQ